jgi:hypothetical protein
VPLADMQILIPQLAKAVAVVPVDYYKDLR